MLLVKHIQLDFSRAICYTNRDRGADIAFDERTLTDYFASRPYTYVYFKCKQICISME